MRLHECNRDAVMSVECCLTRERELFHSRDHSKSCAISEHKVDGRALHTFTKEQY
jgi:hypothetical protein